MPRGAELASAASGDDSLFEAVELSHKTHLCAGYAPAVAQTCSGSEKQLFVREGYPAVLWSCR